jgi:beta-lactamase class A
MTLDRRDFLASAAAVTALGAEAVGAHRAHLDDDPTFAEIRRSLGPGTRLGIMAVDTGSGRRISIDAHSRYAMCSTFKLALAAFVLRLADIGAFSLSEELTFGPGDPLANSPIVEANLKAGKLRIETLAAAALRYSDNSAANLLLRKIGGPAALTRFIRACGDRVTRLDRYELALNSNIIGDPRDTTTPAAMAELAQALVLGKALPPPSNTKLTDWFVTSVVKPDRLKAGFPADWRVGHKPGTGSGGAFNDVAIAWPPGRPPIVVAAFMSGGQAGEVVRAAAYRTIARVVAQRFG